MFGINEVRAETYSGQIAEKEWIRGIFIKKSMPSGSSYKYEQARFIRRSDGQFVYCLQPYVFVEPGATYHVEKSDYLQVVNMTQEQWNRVRLLAYYGYGYGNHTEDKWYAVTQLLIWRTVSPNTQIFFTNTMNGTRNDSLYIDEINEINDLVSKHLTRPSFHNDNLTLSMGQTVSLNDENQVLSKYKVTSSDNVSASIDGNTLNITATEIGQGTINLKKSDTKYHIPPIIYYSSNSQDVFSVGYYDPVPSTLTLNVIGSKIKVVKVDSETNSCTAQGQASLIGAKYDIFDSNNNVVSHLTIGSDCTAMTDYLPLGHYTIKEVEPSTGYQLDDTIYTVDVNTSDTFTVTVKENVVKGHIKVNKVDSDTNSCTSSGKASLVGAIYEVLDLNNNVVDTLTIGDDCTGISKALPYGNYKVKEKMASEGYNLDTNIYDVTIHQDTTVEITSKEEIQKGIIKLTKVDSETNSCTPQGQATLIGAIYEILNWNNTVVDTLIIGEDCTASSKLLPLGEYTVREKTPSTGYYISNRISHVNITNALEYSLPVEEDVIKNYINILKQYDYVDGNSTLLDAEPNITFEIFFPNGQKYSQITTDKNGHATINIPYGRWIFHQVNTHDGFSKVHDFTITVDETTPKEHYYNILNNKLSAYLQIVKKDKETGKTISLPNTTFKILNTDTNQFVSQFVGGIVHSTFKTNEKGIATTYLKLEAGNYRIVEVEAPTGYLINNEGLDFTIGSNTEYKYTNYGTFVVIDFENTPIKGRIEINKKGEKVIFENGKIQYEQIPLQDVEFQIYADEDITSSDGQYLYYKKDELVSTLITNENGYAISEFLPLGKYYLLETKTHNSHVLDTKKYHFILQSSNNNVAIVYEMYNSLNYLKKGELEFTKKDFSTDEALPNTKIQIFTENDKLVFEGKTDGNGKITIDELPYGKYYILEVEAPKGYLLNEEKMYFEIAENGEVIKSTMKDEKIKGNLIFLKVDEQGNPLEGVSICVLKKDGIEVGTYTTNSDGLVTIEDLEYGDYLIKEISTIDGYKLTDETISFSIIKDGEDVKVSMKNEKIKGNLVFKKIDDKGNILEGVTIRVFKSDGTLVGTYTTNSDGLVTIEDLEYGDYVIKEISTVEGYKLSEEEIPFSITKDGEYVHKTLVNELMEIEVPNTLKNKNYIVEFFAFLFVILGIVIIVQQKRGSK